MHRNNKKIIAVLYLVIFTINTLIFQGGLGNAKVKFGGLAINSEFGSILYIARNKEATNSTIYATMGWIIRFDKAEGKPKTKDNNYAIMWYTDEGASKSPDIPDGEGYVKTKYTFTRDSIENALKKKDQENGNTKLTNKFYDIENNDGGIIYLNAIIQVCQRDENGKITKEGAPIYSYDKIVVAAPWGSIESFPDYYDVQVQYDPIQDFPTTVELRTDQDILLKTTVRDNSKINTDQTTSVSDFPKTFTSKEGITYSLYRSYYINLNEPDVPKKDYSLDDGYSLSTISNRTAKVRSPGLKFVGMYEVQYEGEEEIKGGTKNKPLEEPTPKAVVGADTRGNESFHVEDGIPVTESVYVQVSNCKNYIVSYTFDKITGIRKYPLTLARTYYLTWTTYEEPDEFGNTAPTEHTDKKTITDTVEIEKAYAYWVVSSINVYALDGTKIVNEALPNDELDLSAYGIMIPTIECKHSTALEQHLFEPKTYRKGTIVIDSAHVVGNGEKPDVPEEDYRLYVNETMISEPIVKNDKLLFNGKTIMSDEETEKEGKAPGEIRDGELIGQDTLYKNGIVIPQDKANSQYDSSGIVRYKNIFHLASKTYKVQINYEIDDINPIVVHTPVVCDGKVSDRKDFNQLITPNSSMASIVLDMDFSVQFPNIGTHRAIKGYGSRDYSKYTARKEILFPFDVYYGKKYVAANTWVAVNEEYPNFYLPTWVHEGEYTIQLRAISINAEANSEEDRTQTIANTVLTNYTAIDTINVQVCGRVYGLTMYDITDYPTWKNVFRQPDSLKLSGVNYTVGTSDQNGLATGKNTKFTFPLVNGSHPENKTVGALKLGYCTRFKLTTLGDMYSENDYVRLKPTFYYVDRDGNNRQEVDLYYTETFNGIRNVMVKVGSDKDKLNVKNYMLGDPYWQVPKAEIKKTAYVKGTDELAVRSQRANLFYFDNMVVPPNLRTYVGDANDTPIGTIPSNVDDKSVIQSVQNWYGEYYLPSEVHVLPKGFDINQYALDHFGIDYKEDIWLKNGYIVINFVIETIDNGVSHLSYINKDNALNGYCNMWKLEGAQLKKTDTDGNVFSFKYGDYVMYFTDKSAAQDYISRGTH